MRTNYFFFCLIILFISTISYSQTVNFDETWKEFLDNNKISNMSKLIKPDKVHDRLDYAKYLLMNTNSCFCQSKIKDAENYMVEIQEEDPQVHKAIPGYVGKMEDLNKKMKAFHSMDVIWKKFLKTKEVDLDELEAISAAKTSCEKQTLAKYSYMTAYYHFCLGDVPTAQNIFENRTLRLAEKTSLRVKDVEGLAPEVAKMKSLFQDMSKLDISWKTYVETGISPGFDIELPLFPCYPIPNMKEFALKGAADLCNAGPKMLEKIRKLEAESGVHPDKELKEKINYMKSAIERNNANLSALNKAWEAFIPDNKVRHIDTYGYEYCSKEPLIRAYIMDGFAYVCDLAEDMLQKIDSLEKSDRTPLQDITKIKINELKALNEENKFNAENIENIWTEFVLQGDKLVGDYESAEYYCDLIHQVKDWTMKGLSGTCEEGLEYLTKIEEFNETFEFSFYKELECRVQKLRIKIWDCRYEALKEMASIEVSTESVEERLEKLMEEYKIGERPEICTLND